MAENLYSCGCHEVDGVLAVTCKPPQVCFRQTPEPEPEKTQPEVSPEPKKRKGPEAVKDSE